MNNNHSIIKQRLNIKVNSETLALSLQPRLGDFNRNKLLPIIEQVFDEFDQPGKHIKIDRLMLDLGTISASHFEEEVEQSLINEIRNVLSATLIRQHHDSNNKIVKQSYSTRQLEQLEHYLCHGHTPYGVAKSEPFDFREKFLNVNEENPEGLLKSIKSLVRSDTVIKRLVTQLDDDGFFHLISLLQPQHAALIIAYLVNLRTIHNIQPLLAMTEERFSRHIRVLTLIYLLREAGTQFNRKSYLKSLLKKMVGGDNKEYKAVLNTLYKAIILTKISLPLHGSLPTVINDLAKDESVTQQTSTTEKTAEPNENLLQSLEFYLKNGYWPNLHGLKKALTFNELLLHLAINNKKALADLIRRIGRSKTVLQRLVLHMQKEVFWELIKVVEPTQALVIITYIGNLQNLHRKRPLITMAAEQFCKLTRLLTLTYILNDAGTQFNRKSFLKSLLLGMAQEQGLIFEDMLLTLARANAILNIDNHGDKSAMPVVIAQLCSEYGIIKPHTGSGDTPHIAKPQSKQVDSPFYLLRNLLLNIDDNKQQNRANQKTVAELIRLLPITGADSLLELLRELVGHPKELQTFCKTIERDIFRKILAALATKQAIWLELFIDELEFINQKSPITQQSQEVFSQNLHFLVLQFILAGSNSSPQPLQFAKHIFHGLARVAGVSVAATITTISSSQKKHHGKKAKSPSPLTVAMDSLFLSENIQKEHGNLYVQTQPYWEDGNPYDRLDWLKYYLHHGLLPWTATLLHPQITPLGIVNSISRLHLSQLRTLFIQNDGKAKQTAILKAVKMLGHQGVHSWLGQLVPELSNSDGLFSSTLKKTVDNISNRDNFYTHLLTAIMTGDRVDFEKLADLADSTTMVANPDISNSPEKWPLHILQSTLLKKLRPQITNNRDNGDDAFVYHGSLTDLLFLLLLKNGKQGAIFIYEVAKDSRLRDTLTEKFSNDELYYVAIEQLCPLGIDTLKSYTDIISKAAKITAPRSIIEIRQAILQQLLKQPYGSPLTGQFFKDSLTALWSPTLPNPVTELLTIESINWQKADGLLSIHGTILNTVLHNYPKQLAVSHKVNNVTKVDDDVFTFLLNCGKQVQGKTNPKKRTKERPPPDQQSLTDIYDTLFIGKTATLLKEQPQKSTDFIKRGVLDNRLRLNWSKTLPESTLYQMATLLDNKKNRVVLSATEILFSSWLQSVETKDENICGRYLFWDFVLGYLRQTSHNIDKLAVAFFDYFRKILTATSRSKDAQAQTSRKFITSATNNAHKLGQHKLSTAIKSLEQRLDDEAKTVEKYNQKRPQYLLKEQKTKTPTSNLFYQNELEADKKPIYISNAGLVLFNPFLPILFKELDLLSQNDAGKNGLFKDGALSRGVHLLQYLVDGRTSAPEPELVLNKILCGASPAIPVDLAIDLNTKELAMADKMHNTVLAQWQILKSSSVAALKETFLQREGRIEQYNDHIKLLIQRKTLDVLVDKVPWSFSVIYHPWMPTPMHVSW
ncbi:MAG: hypothetical protein HQL69_07120 [Magnetococcales bacterium]|nr:hypothetical protein [Magnetococcales bacterium]